MAKKTEQDCNEQTPPSHLQIFVTIFLVLQYIFAQPANIKNCTKTDETPDGHAKAKRYAKAAQ